MLLAADEARAYDNDIRCDVCEVRRADHDAGKLGHRFRIKRGDHWCDRADDWCCNVNPSCDDGRECDRDADADEREDWR